MSDEREPTEDELIDFMDWLIDHKPPDEQIDMTPLFETVIESIPDKILFGKNIF